MQREPILIRFSKENLERLCEMFPELQHDPRGGAISIAQRLCVFLTYCAENGYQVELKTYCYYLRTKF